MISTDQAGNTEVSNRELYKIILELTRKINEIHHLHFSEPELKTRKNQKQKFLAEILTNPARNSKSR